MQPRGEPQLVGLTQLTYQAGLLKIRDRGPQPCTQEDFNGSFIDQTLSHFYPKAKDDQHEEFSPERTTTKRSFSNRSRSMSGENQANLSCDRGAEYRKETS